MRHWQSEDQCTSIEYGRVQLPNLYSNATRGLSRIFMAGTLSWRKFFYGTLKVLAILHNRYNSMMRARVRPVKPVARGPLFKPVARGPLIYSASPRFRKSVYSMAPLADFVNVISNSENSYNFRVIRCGKSYAQIIYIYIYETFT